MKKRYYLIIVLAFCLFLTGCKKTECEKKGHNFNEATCEKAKECSVCSQTEGNPLGHTVVTDNKIEATCTTNGLTEGSHCSVCNKVLVEQKEIVSEGHKWTDEEKLECLSCGLDKIVDELKTIIPSETNKSITLPETVLGYQITWESSDIDAMLNDGLIVARNDAKVLCYSTCKGVKCKNLEQIQFKSTKTRRMKC